MATVSNTGEDRLLTVPNVITTVRLLCVPVFLWILFGHHPHDRYHAALLLAAMGITDFVDGYLARHLHQVSTLGKVLDPIADRLLLGVGVVAVQRLRPALSVRSPGQQVSAFRSNTR